MNPYFLMVLASFWVIVSCSGENDNEKDILTCSNLDGGITCYSQSSEPQGCYSLLGGNPEESLEPCDNINLELYPYSLKLSGGELTVSGFINLGEVIYIDDAEYYYTGGASGSITNSGIINSGCVFNPIWYGTPDSEEETLCLSVCSSKKACFELEATFGVSSRNNCSVC